MLKSTFKIENLKNLLDSNPQITDILYLGGDGSINYLINHIDISTIKQNIYISQSGSGNDFSRSLVRVKKSNVTIGKASTNNGDFNFINGAGIGIDSLICHYVNNDKKKSKLSYFLHFFRAIIKYRRMSFEVTVDGVKHEFKNAYLVAVQNGSYFGGGMKIAPSSDISSDDYTVVVAHNLNNLLIQALFVTIYLGWHKYIKKRVTFLKGKEINIKANTSYFFQVDGEVHDEISEINIKKIASKEFNSFNKSTLKNTVNK
jgi:diacylglycerol kinase family enzyme